MKFETLNVAGFLPAIAGMRNPMNSWHLSDSYTDGTWISIGEADIKLAKKLISGGPEHRKFLRMIQVWVDVTAPRYWWQEADTYQFGTKNSCSTMHKLHDKPFMIEDFYVGDDASVQVIAALDVVIKILNELRDKNLETRDYGIIVEMKRILPESYMQMRTWNTNYEQLLNICNQRKHHRLKDEWGAFCKWCNELPYFSTLTEEVIK